MRKTRSQGRHQSGLGVHDEVAQRKLGNGGVVSMYVGAGVFGLLSE